MPRISAKFYVAPLLATAVLMAAGCAPAYNNRPYNTGVYEQPARNDGYRGNSRCSQCGVVQSVQRVYLDGGNSGHGTLGAVIGAIAGGVLGSAVGKGDGRKAATVVGAVAGGVAGNQVGERTGGGDQAYRVVLNMDDGQQAVVTQRDNPGLRSGDYAEIRGQQVYAR